MTLREAEIVLDTVGVALQKPSPALLRRESELRGYGVFEIDKAVKLRIARLYLESRKGGYDDEWFRKAVEAHSAIPVLVIQQFAPDEDVDELEKLDQDTHEFGERLLSLQARMLDEANPRYRQWLKLETVDSFAGYCQHIGFENPFYWRMIYDHIGLEYQHDMVSTDVLEERSVAHYSREMATPFPDGKRPSLVSLVDSRDIEETDTDKRLKDYPRRWIVFGVLALFYGLFDSVLMGDAPAGYLGVAYSLGKSFGFLLLPAVIPGIVALGYRFFRRKLPPYKWIRVYTIIFALFFLGGVIRWSD